MNSLDGVIAWLSPAWAAERARARRVIQAYEAAQPSRLRRQNRQTSGPVTATRSALKPLRDTARALEEDYDLVVGILNAFVNNVVGQGVAIEPQPKRRNGELHRELADELLFGLEQWSQHVDATGECDLGAAERLACRSWCRDGEVFAQHLVAARGFSYASPVPYALELLEADNVPHDYEDLKRNIRQGIQRDAWGKATAYNVYQTHPGETYRYRDLSYRSIPAEQMLHLKHTARIHQGRGISMLAPVITRLSDIKDYEESERVAARIAAAFAAYVRKGTPEDYAMAEKDEDDERLFTIAPGIIWDNLLPGEDVGTVQSNRPSNLLAPFRDAMLRAVAAGVGPSYSSISRNYSGTYSSQRQELVESFVNYSVATANFISQWSRPVYNKYLMAHMLRRERLMQGRALADLTDLDPASLDDAIFRGPVMPWIDPVKEVQASIQQVQAGFKSRSQVIRERAGNPDATFQELQRERERDYDAAMVFVSDYAHIAQRGSADVDPRDNEMTNNEQPAAGDKAA